MSPVNLLNDILETAVESIAFIFLAGAKGNIEKAKDIARQMIASYNPGTEDELRLASKIVSCSFQVLEALGQAAMPDIPLTRILRLRSGAVSLSRESHKAQRKLDQLQRDRRLGRSAKANEARGEKQSVEKPLVDEQSVVDQPAVEQPVAEPPNPRIENAIALIAETREVIASNRQNGQYGGMTLSQAFKKRELAKRIAENVRKNQERHAAQVAAVGNQALPPA